MVVTLLTHNIVKNQNVANDASEHALNLLTVFNTGKVAQTKKQKRIFKEHCQYAVAKLLHLVKE